MKLHPHVRDLLDEIDAYCARTGTDRTRFGVRAMNDGHFVPRLESGRQPRFATVDKVRRFIRQGEKRR